MISFSFREKKVIRRRIEKQKYVKEYSLKVKYYKITIHKAFYDDGDDW